MITACLATDEKRKRDAYKRITLKIGKKSWHISTAEAISLIHDLAIALSEVQE